MWFFRCLLMPQCSMRSMPYAQSQTVISQFRYSFTRKSVPRGEPLVSVGFRLALPTIHRRFGPRSNGETCLCARRAEHDTANSLLYAENRTPRRTAINSRGEYDVGPRHETRRPSRGSLAPTQERARFRSSFRASSNPTDWSPSPACPGSRHGAKQRRGNTHRRSERDVDYVFRTRRYDQNRTGWAQASPLGCRCQKRGNCTGSLHINRDGESRKKIPSDSRIGFSIHNDNERPDMVDTMLGRFYTGPEAGGPVDISEAGASGKTPTYSSVPADADRVAVHDAQRPH